MMSMGFAKSKMIGEWNGGEAVKDIVRGSGVL